MGDLSGKTKFEELRLYKSSPETGTPQELHLFIVPVPPLFKKKKKKSLSKYVNMLYKHNNLYIHIFAPTQIPQNNVYRYSQQCFIAMINDFIIILYTLDKTLTKNWTCYV